MPVPSVFGALDHEGIPFVLIGGAALTAYGSPRVSLDTDIAIKAIDIDRVVDVAYREGLVLVVGVNAEQHPVTATTAESAQLFLTARRQGFLKFLSRELELDAVYDNPVPFMRMYASALVLDLDGVPVRVASLEHLKTMKEVSVQTRDDEEAIEADRFDLRYIQKQLERGSR